MNKPMSKISTVLMILFLISCFSPLNLYPQTDETKWLQGYRKSLKGGTIEYHSAQPDVKKALLVRSMNAEDYIEW